jgi:uncharacterized protein YjbK
MENIEIEFKNLLTKEEYDLLVKHFKVTDFFTQVNHYLDTSHFILKEAKVALRVRIKNDTYEFTLKEKIKNGNLETNQMITKNEYEKIISEGTPPVGAVFDKITSIIGDNKLINHVSIKTKRSEFEYGCGLLVLDHSTFGTIEDYEVEFEVEDFEKGKVEFEALMNEFRIQRKQAFPKIKRAFDYKKEV